MSSPSSHQIVVFCVVFHSDILFSVAGAFRDVMLSTTFVHFIKNYIRQHLPREFSKCNLARPYLSFSAIKSLRFDWSMISIG